MSPDLVLAAVAGGSGVAGATVAKVIDWAVSRTVAKKTANKIDVDAAAVIASTAVTLIAPLKTEIAELQSRVDGLETEKNLTNSRLALAIEHIRALRSWIGTHVSDKKPPEPPTGLGI